MAEQPSQSPENAPQPVSLRTDSSAQPPNAPPASRGISIPAFIAGVVVTAVVMLILFSALTSDNTDSLSEDDVRTIVSEAIGTQSALLPPALAAPGEAADAGAVSAASIQEMVDNAVGTEVALLIPTNTPLPPTPTMIPVGVAEDDDAFRGPDDAPVVIVEFSDFQCGYCGRWYNTTLPAILEAYPDQVKFVYRDFPIFGEESLRAAMATECAEEQDPEAFWGMHNRLFDRLTNQESIDLSEESLISFAEDLDLDTASFSECLTSQKYYDEVLNDYRAASEYGLGGTPGFVINGVVYAIGAQSFEYFDTIIQAELANVNVEG